MNQFSMTQGDRNERRHDDVPGNGRDSADAADVRKLLSSFDFGDLLANLDSFADGSAEGGDEVDVLPTEEPDDLASRGDPELALAAFRNVPNIATQRRRKKDSHLRNLTEEDFEGGVERMAFRAMSANVEAMFHDKTKPEDTVAAAHWVFGTERGDFSFENCSLLLGSRPDVIRLRIQYEFWKRQVAFPDGFIFTVDPLPEIIYDQLNISWRAIGIAIGEIAWFHPGIRTSALIEKVCKSLKLTTEEETQRVRETLLKMGESSTHYISYKPDSWWLTGRNPQLRSELIKEATGRGMRDTVSWSKLF